MRSRRRLVSDVSIWRSNVSRDPSVTMFPGAGLSTPPLVAMNPSRHELSLTDAGESLLAKSRERLPGWEAFEESCLGDPEHVSGTLKVVAPVALGQSLLGDIACRFQQDHPHVVHERELEDRPIRCAALGCDCWSRVGAVSVSPSCRAGSAETSCETATW